MGEFCDFCCGPKAKPWTRFCQTQCQRDQNALDYLVRKKLKLQKEAKVKPK